MSRRAALAAAALALPALAGCASPGTQRWLDDRELERANPSAVIAAELALAREAQERGQWTAFTRAAASEAVLFVPQPIPARDWLRRQADPAQATRWQPHQVWSSCDGTLALSRGAWQGADGAAGVFTTAWQRRNTDRYRWSMHQRDTLPAPLTAPDLIEARSADCTTPPAPAPIPTAGAAGERQAVSNDRTFYWHVAVDQGGGRTLTAGYWDGAAWQVAVNETFASE